MSYSKGSCRQIEKNIEQSLQNEKVDIQKRKEQEVINGLQNSKNKVEDLAKDNTQQCENIDGGIQRLDNTKRQYSKIAQDLRIDYESEIDPSKMRELLKRVKGQIEQMQGDVKGIQISDTDFEQNSQIGFKLKELGELNKNIGNCLGSLSDEDLDAIEKNELQRIKKGISLKIGQIKAEADIKKLDAEKGILKGKRNPIWKVFDKITGQEKVRLTELEQIEVKKQTVKAKTQFVRMEDRQDYSVDDMLSEIDVYVNQNRNSEATKEELVQLQIFRTKITSHSELEVDERVVEDKTSRELQAGSSVVPRKKENFFKKAFGNKQKQIEDIKNNTDQWIKENGYYTSMSVMNFPKTDKVTSILNKTENIIAKQQASYTRERSFAAAR